MWITRLDCTHTSDGSCENLIYESTTVLNFPGNDYRLTLRLTVTHAPRKWTSKILQMCVILKLCRSFSSLTECLGTQEQSRPATQVWNKRVEFRPFLTTWLNENKYTTKRHEPANSSQSRNSNHSDGRVVSVFGLKGWKEKRNYSVNLPARTGSSDAASAGTAFHWTASAARRWVLLVLEQEII